MEYDMSNVQSSIGAENYVLKEHRIVENCRLENNASVCIYDWAEVI